MTETSTTESNWLSQAKCDLDQRDVVDAYHDALALLEHMENRMTRFLPNAPLCRKELPQ